MCASSSVINQDFLSFSQAFPGGEGAPLPSSEGEAFFSIYQKALSFGLVSSNKDSSSPCKRSLQLCALRASTHPNLSAQQKELVNHVFKWSFNFTRESSLFQYRQVTIGSEQIQMTIHEINNLLFPAMFQDPVYSVEAFEHTALEIIKWGVGNCWEYSCLIYVLLMELKHTPPVPMEIIRITSSWDAVTSDVVSHVFILVGRDPMSDLKNPSSWGPNAWIIDPWWEKFGAITKYQDVMERHAEHMHILFSGEVGQGHSASWPELFPQGKLMDYIPPKKEEEQIPWALEKSQEVLLFAQKTIDELKALGQRCASLNTLKPWLLNQKKLKLPTEMKIQLFSALVPVFKSLASGFWAGQLFSTEDFWRLWNDPDIQRWVCVEDMEPHSDQISLKTAFELFQTAFKTEASLLCNEFWVKNLPLRILLESKGFQFSMEMFNVYRVRQFTEQLQACVGLDSL